ncbi:MAG: hypothetical protein M2R45_04536 [Verrucomicrobia subdivision 3 bacterium]|nr:hypothetical protein [Limisphaerales bacterium]MCS1416825.1 hypothetical protein [Limisphaerales bacterium]
MLGFLEGRRLTEGFVAGLCISFILAAVGVMTDADQWHWTQRHGVGLSLVVLAYLLVTILRSLRADFTPELWKDLGTTELPSVFALSESWVAQGVW